MIFFFKYNKKLFFFLVSLTSLEQGHPWLNQRQIVWEKKIKVEAMVKYPSGKAVRYRPIHGLVYIYAIGLGYFPDYLRVPMWAHAMDNLST